MQIRLAHAILEVGIVDIEHAILDQSGDAIAGQDDPITVIGIFAHYDVPPLLRRQRSDKTEQVLAAASADNQQPLDLTMPYNRQETIVQAEPHFTSSIMNALL